MKRFIYLILVVIMAFTVTACSRRTEQAENMTESAISIPGSNESKWNEFLKAIAHQGIPDEAIHTLENSGMTREKIMSMSPEELKSELAKIESNIQQNNLELAKKMLVDWSLAKNDPQFVFSDIDGSTNIHLVEELINSVKTNDGASFKGLFLGTIPVVYELSYQPNEGLLFTRYSGWEEIVVFQSTITDIYTTDTLYEFTDQDVPRLSIPKVSLEVVEPVIDYPNGSAAVTAKQAKEAMIHIDALLYAYIEYIRETYGRNAMGGFGVIIPEEFTLHETPDTDKTAVVEEMAQISDHYYYLVSYYQNGEFSGNSYYINAEEPGAGTAFMISMADGNLIPVCYKNISHLAVKGK